MTKARTRAFFAAPVDLEALRGFVDARLRAYDTDADYRHIVEAWRAFRRFGMKPTPAIYPYLDRVFDQLPRAAMNRAAGVRQHPWFALIQAWLANGARGQIRAEPLTVDQILREAIGEREEHTSERGHATRVGLILAELGYTRKEDKGIPERYHYVKRRGSEEGDKVVQLGHGSKARASAMLKT